MARIPLVENKHSLAPEHQGIYDAIVKSRGELRGCLPALLHVPAIADHTASLGGYLRFDGKFEPKVRTLAALTASREWDCVHEWAAGVKNAEKNRISSATLVAVHQRRPTTGLPRTKLKSSTTFARSCIPIASPNRHFNRCSPA
ncbi:MAG: carboxymuconolactone decarboxylase family protein [Candidatus Binatia bacterium]